MKATPGTPLTAAAIILAGALHALHAQQVTDSARNQPGVRGARVIYDVGATNKVRYPQAFKDLQWMKATNPENSKSYIPPLPRLPPYFISLPNIQAAITRPASARISQPNSILYTVPMITATWKHLLLALGLTFSASIASSHAQIPIKIPGAPRIPGFDNNSGGGNIDPVKTYKGVEQFTKGALGVNRNEENVIGESVALGIIAKYGGLSRDMASTVRVIRIGRTLIRYAPRAGLTYRFAILNSNTPNAFSAPGGYIFITRGMLAKCKSDGMVAAVLAHEIAHVMRRHALRSISKANMASGLLKLGTVAAGAAGGPSIPDFDNAVDQVLSQMLQKGYSKSDEYDADREGAALLKTAGYDPALMAQTIQALDNGGKSVDYHPETADRVARLQKGAKK
ncbi:hypothetical protein DB346_21325 [Verrucomicrobia bacterium LW23]|nr:hypothetical protein DB346_21325 [Verrucomicrobia bacterium LW23]